MVLMMGEGGKDGKTATYIDGGEEQNIHISKHTMGNEKGMKEGREDRQLPQELKRPKENKGVTEKNKEEQVLLGNIKEIEIHMVEVGKSTQGTWKRRVHNKGSMMDMALRSSNKRSQMELGRTRIERRFLKK